MKGTLGHLVIVILLLAGGEIFRRTATFEDVLSASQEHLTTRDAADTAASEDVAISPPLAASLPVVGPWITADLRRQRALAAYWRGDYSGADPTRIGADPARSGADPSDPPDGALRFIAANAMFRDLARRPGGSQAIVAGLDAVMKAYVSVLETDPTAVDAAYNYEFVSRLRAAAAAGRANSSKLPPESNIEGEKGTPPSQTKPTEFNIIVPLRPEERQEQIDPRSGAAPQRKG